MFSTIRSRLLLGFSAAWLISASVTAVAAASAHFVNGSALETTRRVVDHTRAVDTLQSSITGFEAEMAEIALMAMDGQDLTEPVEDAARYAAAADEALADVTSMASSHDLPSFRAAEGRVGGDWGALKQDALNSLARRDLDAARALSERLSLPIAGRRDTMIDVLDRQREGLDARLVELRRMHAAEAFRQIEEIRRLSTFYSLASWAIAVAGLVITALLGAWIYHGIQRPIDRAAAHAAAVTDGALETHLDERGPTEIAQLTDVIEHMRESLVERIFHLAAMTAALADAARRTSGTASELVETSLLMSSVDISRAEANDRIRAAAATMAREAAELKRLAAEAERVMEADAESPQDGSAT